MSKKILISASRFSHIVNFHMPYIQYFTEHHYTVDIVAESKSTPSLPTKNTRIYNESFGKTITSWDNIKTLVALRRLIRTNQYDIIISNSTLAGFLTRMAVRLSGRHKKKDLRVVHIAHGYLFSNNTPKIKKGTYLLIEKLCKPVTDCLLVMNKEDLEIAQTHKLSKHTIHYIDGIGIDTDKLAANKISKEEKQKIREYYNIQDDDIVLIYPAEFSKRKNQGFLIELFHELKKQNKLSHVKLILAGTGKEYDTCRHAITTYQLEKHILTPGHIKPIYPLLQASDIAISSAKSEGLPFNIIEAIYYEKPILASNVKGHTDLVQDKQIGCLFDLNTNNIAQTATILYDTIQEQVAKNEPQTTPSSNIVKEKFALNKVFNANVKFIIGG